MFLERPLATNLEGLKMKINELRQLKAKAIANMRALQNKADDEKRDLSKEETELFDKYTLEVNSLNKKIEREETLSSMESDLGEPATRASVEPARAKADSSVVVGEEHENKFRSFGEFLTSVRKANTPGVRIDKRLEQRAGTGLSVATPSDGGFLVQMDFATELLKRTYDQGLVANRVKMIPIGASSNGLKMNAIDETSRVDGSRYGGVQAYWADEGGTITGSKPKFRQMEMNLHKLTGLCYATDELLADEVALESVIMDAFASEFAFKLDDAFVNGDGVSKPLGILNTNNGSLVVVSKESGQAASTVVIQNIVKMYSRLWARSRGSAVWYINQDILPQLFTMTLAVGSGGSVVYMPAGQIAGQPFDTLLGIPVIPIEQCASLTSQGDIILADMSQYVAISKGAMQAASSIHVRFVNDESVFRFTYRCDGQPAWNSALTPFKGSNTQSPFITLQNR